MAVVAELTPSQGVELALTILLEKGFADDYYISWQDFAKENYSEDFDEDYKWSLSERQSAWESLFEGVKKNETFIAEDGTSACWVADESDGDWQHRETFFVVLRLIDDSGTRYFMREGYYHSYDGGHLEEGEDKEVSPRAQIVTVWRNE